LELDVVSFNQENDVACSEEGGAAEHRATPSCRGLGRGELLRTLIALWSKPRKEH
jgi:hypothetical protein